VFTNNLISSAGGTWFVDLRNNLSLIRDLSSTSLDLSDVSASFGFRIKTYSGGQRFSIIKLVSSVETPLYTTLTNNAKIAIKWNGTTADVFVNGFKVVTNDAFALTAMQILLATGSAVTINLNDTALYNTPISDAECIQITTL
jgi:hypothetical protein